MDFAILHSNEIGLSIQIMSFVIALIVTQMAVIEWRRNRNTMYKYLTFGFGILFAQITINTVLFIHWFVNGSFTIPGSTLEHILQTASYVYIGAAFITTKTSLRSRFIRTNYLALVILAPLALITRNLPDFAGVQTFMQTWSDLLFGIWNIGLLGVTIAAILNSNVRMKKGLVVATCLLLVKHSIHLANTNFLSQQSAVLLLLEHAVFLFYFYAIVTTLHNEIISDLLSVDKEKNRLKEKAHQETIRALINSLEAKDEYTRGHSDRVTEYAMVIGQRLGFDTLELTKLYYGAILHDIGKIGISEDILNKPFSLGSDDFDIMKKHPEIGATIVSSIESLKHIATSILYHHERYDGSGYPQGLKGQDIPLHSRIIAITDALDAMSSTRTYRSSLTEEKAIRELIHGAGTQFDPYLVKIFVEAIGIEIKDSDLKKLSRSA